jgi:mRNA-degrading endonuclease RelE of RelBE toxin-antitoxin system
MAYNTLCVFLETPPFTRRIRELISDNEYRLIQLALGFRPEQGVVIPGTGGIRKIRWSREGRGKRGGIRIIYYWHRPKNRIYMLLAYPKSEQDNLTADQARILSQLVKEEFR